MKNLSSEEKLFLKLAASNIPGFGSSIVQILNYADSGGLESVAQSRLQALSDAIIKLANGAETEQIEVFLRTHGFTTYESMLKSYYFGNGSKKILACKVHLGAWRSGAFHEFEQLSNQDKISSLKLVLYFYSKYSNYSDRPKYSHYFMNWNDEELLDLVQLARTDLEKIDETAVRYEDVAAIHYFMGILYNHCRNYAKAAISLLKALEYMIYQGSLSLAMPHGEGVEIYEIIGRLGYNFYNLGMKVESEDCFLNFLKLKSYYQSVKNVQKHGGLEPDILRMLGKIYESKNQIELAVEYFEKHLAELRTKTYSGDKKESDRVNNRQFYAKYVMTNGVGRQRSDKCLCGVYDLIYGECCGKDDDLSVWEHEYKSKGISLSYK